ncbi:MAG: alpha/beta hydrolase [Leptolinea sp.]|nr:alpha/beta hydrolase [Leptolinea sp.]
MIWKDGYTSIKKHSVYFQHWVPDQTINARVLLVHGLGEHSGRYAHVGEYFTETGIALTGFDLLGHGKTDGQRGHADSFDDFCLEIDYFLSELKSSQPAAPVILYGHSLGGLIVLYYLLNKNPQTIKGVICTSPGLAPGYPIPAWKTTLGNILYTLLPRFSMDNGLPLDGISHDTAVVSAYRADQLNHPKISARLGTDLIRNGQQIGQRAQEVSLPILLMVGSDDFLIDPKAVIDFGQCAGKTTTLKVWDGGYHELHNEVFKEKVLQTMVDWIHQNTGS